MKLDLGFTLNHISRWHYVNYPVRCNPALPAVILDFRLFLCLLLKNIHTYYEKKGHLISDLGQVTFVLRVHVWIISGTTPPESNLQNEVKFSLCRKLRTCLDPNIPALWLMSY